MKIWQIIRRLGPFVRPCKWLVAASLVLRFVGALAAQVNPIARLFLKDPPVIYLDEPTASPDAIATGRSRTASMRSRKTARS